MSCSYTAGGLSDHLVFQDCKGQKVKTIKIVLKVRCPMRSVLDTDDNTVEDTSECALFSASLPEPNSFMTFLAPSATAYSIRVWWQSSSTRRSSGLMMGLAAPQRHKYIYYFVFCWTVTANAGGTTFECYQWHHCCRSWARWFDWLWGSAFGWTRSLFCCLEASAVLLQAVSCPVKSTT